MEDWKPPEGITICPALAFGRIVGGKYKLRILWALNRRPHRYGELKAVLLRGNIGPSVTPRTLSRELKELQQRGLIDRRQWDEVPPRVEYSLTERGTAMMPIIDAIVDWGLTGAHQEILALPSAADVA